MSTETTLDHHTANVCKAFEQPQGYLSVHSIIDLRARIVREMLGELKDASILDIGCGDGAISMRFLPQNKVTFLDLSHAMLEVTRQRVPTNCRDQAEFVHGDFMAPEFGRQFDAVLCVGVLQHVRHVADALEHLSRLTREGGSCIVQITDADTLMAACLRVYCRIRDWLLGSPTGYALTRISRSEVVSIGNRHGLELRREQRYSCLPPGMRHLPSRICAGYLRRSSASRFAKYGSELVMMFERRWS